MARIHGRRGMLYMALNAGGAPAPIAFLSDWTINFTPSYDEVTPLAGKQRIYVPSTVEANGDFQGFYDDSARQFYTAARDGIPRNFYLYPDIVDDPAQAWFGSFLPDFSVSGGVGSAVNVRATWKAASQIGEMTSLAPQGGLLDESGAMILDEAGSQVQDEG